MIFKICRLVSEFCGYNTGMQTVFTVVSNPNLQRELRWKIVLRPRSTQRFAFGSRSSPQISLFLDILIWCATFSRWMALLANAQKGNDCAFLYSESVMPLIFLHVRKKGRDSQVVTWLLKCKKKKKEMRSHCFQHIQSDLLLIKKYILDLKKIK